MKTIKLDTSKVIDVEIDGIDHSDAPDYCDAYVSNAGYIITKDEFDVTPIELNPTEYKGKYFRDLTDTELDWLNDNARDFVYNKIMNRIH